MVTFGTPKPRWHRELIREQFTRQAVPFANAPAIRDASTLGRMVDVSGAVASVEQRPLSPS
jgi:hypothetical protein